MTHQQTATLAIPTDVVDRLEAHGIRLGPILDQVEDRLMAYVSSSNAFVDQASRYLIAAGGKRFRPMIVGLVAHLGDPGRDQVPDAGVMVELVHLATLYHDDVIDEAEARRGTPSANLRWDNTVAILTGDFLFARASELSAELGVEATRVMAQTFARLCEGQIREVQGSRGAVPPDVPPLEPTREHYLQVISEKTASLIETSCRLGAHTAGCSPEVVETCARYGWNVGMAFQLSDDILDIASDPMDSGKTPGTDLREGVRTMPILLALEADGGGELATLLDAVELTDAEVARALELLRAGPGLKLARDEAATYVDAAIAEAASLGETPVTRALRRLATYALDRVG